MITLTMMKQLSKGYLLNEQTNYFDKSPNKTFNQREDIKN